VAANDAITLSSDTLTSAGKELTTAASSLSAASSSLDSAIPGNAFGTAGAPLATAGNQVGAEIGKTLDSLAKLARASATAVAATQKEFERIEEEAISSFRGTGGGLI